jgi:hypothetical protein
VSDRFALAVVAVAMLVLAPGASAAPVEEVVESGEVIATLSYDKRKDGTFRDFRVKIVRAGQELVDEGLPDGCHKCFAFPAQQGAGEKSIRIRDLDSDGEPEVIADLYTGGAHCCTLSTLYGFEDFDGGRYRRLRHNWLDAGYILRDLGRDGRVDFVSRDARFAYTFASYAESFLPVQTFEYSRPVGKKRWGLFDTSPRFRGLLRKDAKRALRLWKRYRAKSNINPRAFLAGWVANQYRLRHRQRANRALARALRRGDLDARSEFEVGKSGRAYVRQLKRFLRRLGY